MTLILAVLASGLIAAFPLYNFFFSEAQFSNAVISWHAAFEKALLTTGEVKLQSLVNFPSERIYFVEAHDRYDAQTEARVFSHANWLDPFWFGWRGDERYWTIAYHRKNRTPFLIRLDQNEWHLRQLTSLSTADPEAKLVLSQSDPSKNVHCPRPWSRCLALSDRTSSP